MLPRDTKMQLSRNSFWLFFLSYRHPASIVTMHNLLWESIAIDFQWPISTEYV